MYRVGVIGCRGIGKRHAQGAALLENAEVVAACDLVPEQRDEFAAQFKETSPALKMYTDYREMLEKAQLDIVTVATGDNRHADLVVAAAEAGAKGIFCEKPLATSVEDADRMVTAAERHNALLSVDHTRHWMPVWHRCHELVTAGEIGDVRAVLCEHYGTRSMLFRNGTHLLDAILWFAGSKPEWLVAELEDGYEDYSEYRGDGGHDPATEPSANAYIHFANGVRGVYLGEKQTPNRLDFTVVGTTGAIFIEREGNAYLERDGERVLVEPRPWEVDGIEAGVHELVRALDGTDALSCTGRDGLIVVEMMIACLQSQQQNNSKVALPLPRIRGGS